MRCKTLATSLFLCAGGLVACGNDTARNPDFLIESSRASAIRSSMDDSRLRGTAATKRCSSSFTPEKLAKRVASA